MVKDFDKLKITAPWLVPKGCFDKSRHCRWKIWRELEGPHHSLSPVFTFCSCFRLQRLLAVPWNPVNDWRGCKRFLPQILKFADECLLIDMVWCKRVLPSLLLQAAIGTNQPILVGNSSSLLPLLSLCRKFADSLIISYNFTIVRNTETAINSDIADIETYMHWLSLLLQAIASTIAQSSTVHAHAHTMLQKCIHKWSSCGLWSFFKLLMQTPV